MNYSGNILECRPTHIVSDVSRHYALVDVDHLSTIVAKKGYRKYCGQLSCSMADFLSNFLASLMLLGT